MDSLEDATPMLAAAIESAAPPVIGLAAIEATMRALRLVRPRAPVPGEHDGTSPGPGPVAGARGRSPAADGEPREHPPRIPW